MACLMWGVCVFVLLAHGSLLASTPKAQRSFTQIEGVALPASLSVDVFLAHSNPAGLRETFLAVSDPSSLRYGKYLSAQQLCDLTKPSPATATAVRAHFRAHGLSVKHASQCGDVLRVTGRPASLEAALQTTIARWQHREEKSLAVWAAASMLHLPPQLASLVRVIHGLHFPVLAKRPASKKTSLASASYATATPAILKQLYGVTVQVANVSASPTSQAVAGWEHQSYSEGDLSHFQRRYSLPR
jgi:subtilase family serine protease